MDQVVHSPLLSLSLSLSRNWRSSRLYFTLSFSFCVPLPTRTRVFLSLSLSLYSKPAIPSSFLLSRLLVRSSSNLRLLSRSRSALPLPLLFSIVHSPAPLALQTLLADEARFVLNFLNFTFRGPSRSSPPFFHGSFISIRLSFHPYRDRSNKRHKRIVNGRIERTMPRALVKRELSVIFLARATSWWL